MASPIELLVLGLGNILCRDDGLGPAAVARLQRDFAPPQGARVLDGGTLGLTLLPLLEDARHVLLVDAVQLDAPSGSLVRLVGADVGPAVRSRLSAHQVGVADLLDALHWLGREPERLVLLGVVPAAMGLGLGLSPAVEAALPALLDRIIEEAYDLGHDFTPLAATIRVPPGAVGAGARELC